MLRDFFVTKETRASQGFGLFCMKKEPNCFGSPLRIKLSLEKVVGAARLELASQ